MIDANSSITKIIRRRYLVHESRDPLTQLTSRNTKSDLIRTKSDFVPSLT